LVICGLAAVISTCILFSPSNNNSDKLKQSIIVFIFTLILVMPIVAGFSSVNKFRKGYDVDASEESEKTNGSQSEDLND